MSRKRRGSSPSQAGFVAVESKIDVVLNSSNSPRAAAGFVFARSASTSASLIGLNVRADLQRLFQNSMLSQPVMTTDVGRFSA